MSIEVQSTPDVVVIGGGPAGSTVSTLIAQQGYRVAAVRARAVSALSHRRIADPGDLLGAEAAQHAAEDAAEPLRQEVQRAVRQLERQAVGAVLLLGQQAARVLADLAGGAQRVRPDDARTTPASTAWTCTRACACSTCSSKAIAPSASGSRTSDGAFRDVRAQGRRRCQRPERPDHEPAAACACGIRC